MTKKIIWFLASCLMAISLVVASCGTAVEEEEEEKEIVTPADDTPKYGGTYNLAQGSDPTNWHPSWVITGSVHCLLYQHMWEGDWTKGPAGGYGTDETDWASANNDLPAFKEGRIAESWEWTTDYEKNEGTIVYQIRQGVHFAINPWVEASSVVNGREVTADDAVYSIKQHLIEDPTAFVFRVNPELRNVEVSKTGPWEVTVKVPINAMITAISRVGDAVVVYPREVAEKYEDLNNPTRSVGTGPFMVKDYVANSSIILVKNPDFWMKDPIGPGKGNQLPYIETVKVLTIPDLSTRQASFRTGQIDFASRYNAEDAAVLRKQCPQLIEQRALSWQGRSNPTYMRLDREPFDDIRVRKALMLATDFQTILDNLHGGEGQIVHLWADTKEYHDLVVGLDDPDFPPEIKELYNYDPDKAKELLAEAGYPDGFKTSIIVSATAQGFFGTAEPDYYSIFNSMWSKVNVDLEIKPMETGVVNTIRMNMEHDPISTQQVGPVAVFHVGNPVAAGNWHNQSMVVDPVIEEALVEVRQTAITDLSEAMKIFREKIYKHWIRNVYSLPSVQGYEYTFWWPWLRNYSGEWSIGYDDSTVPMFIWIDQEMKEKMGY